MTYGIVAALAPKRHRTDLVTVFQIFLYGVAAYALTGIGQRFLSCIPGATVSGNQIFSSEIFKEGTPVDFNVVVWASVVGVLQGMLITVAQNRSWAHRVCRELGLTKRFADADGWN